MKLGFIKKLFKLKASKKKGPSKLDRLKDKINTYPVRERVLFFLFSCIVIFAIWYFLLLSPLLNSKKSISLRIVVAQKQLETIQQKRDEMISKGKTPEDKEKRAALVEGIQRLDKKIYSITHQVLPAENMIEFLQGILMQVPQLQFISFNSSPAIPMGGESEQSQKELSDNYLKQQFALKFRGGFFPILRYLQYVENAKWRVFWDALIYDVPSSTVGISVHSLIHEKNEILLPRSEASSSKKEDKK